MICYTTIITIITVSSLVETGQNDAGTKYKDTAMANISQYGFVKATEL